MNSLLRFVGSLLYFVFMFFFMPLLAVLLLLQVCYYALLFIGHMGRYLSRMAMHMHLVRRQMPPRRIGRRLAAVHA